MVNIDEKLEEGYIQGRFIIEIVGQPKEHIEKAIKLLIDKIKENKDIEIVSKDIAEAKELEKQKGFFSVFAELELLMSSLPVLTGFCFDYMPSSVDIMAPDELKSSARELNGILNDLQAKMHKLDNAVKQMHMEGNFMKSNTNKILKNFVTLLIVKEGKTAEEIAKYIGFTPDGMKIFLESLVKENKLKKEGEKYFLVKNE